MDLIEVRRAMRDKGISCLPTTDLKQVLRELIAKRKAIEIGSGNNLLCGYLQILGTDSFAGVKDATLSMWMTSIGFSLPTPNIHLVKEMEALEAVEHYKPKVVIGAWIPDKHTCFGKERGYGVDEVAILESPYVETYIHIGNTLVHQNKTINQIPHKVFDAPTISIANRGKDIIQVWTKVDIDSPEGSVDDDNYT
jgi:hypothetical protein